MRPLRASILVRSPERGATSRVSPRALSEPMSPVTTVGSRRTPETVPKVGLIRSSVRNSSFGPEPKAHTEEPTTARLCAPTASVLEAATSRDSGEMRSTERGGDETQTDPAP